MVLHNLQPLLPVELAAKHFSWDFQFLKHFITNTSSTKHEQLGLSEALLRTSFRMKKR